MNKRIVNIKNLISDDVCMGTYGLVELELLAMEKELKCEQIKAHIYTDLYNKDIAYELSHIVKDKLGLDFKTRYELYEAFCKVLNK